MKKAGGISVPASVPGRGFASVPCRGFADLQISLNSGGHGDALPGNTTFRDHYLRSDQSKRSTNPILPLMPV